jgi:hypothetical protein
MLIADRAIKIITFGIFVVAAQVSVAASCRPGSVLGFARALHGDVQVCAAAPNADAPNVAALALNTLPRASAIVQVEFTADPIALASGVSTHPINNYGASVRVGGREIAAVGSDLSVDLTRLFYLQRPTFGFGINGVGSIDLDTGVAAEAVPLKGLDANEGVLGFAIDPRSGEAFVTTFEFDVGTRLRRVNLATNDTTLVGVISTEGLALDIAINCNGEMFAITPSLTVPKLLRINRNTAAPTLVGTYGILGDLYFQSIDFDNRDGRLYGWLLAGNPPDNPQSFAYGTFNTTTAQFTTLSSRPVAQVFGALATRCAEFDDLIFRDGLEIGIAAS